MNGSMDMTPIPSASPFLGRPETPAGRWAGWSALIAVAALLVANLLFQDATGIWEAVRVGCIMVFAAGGLAALVMSIRCLMQRERSVIVWASLVVGSIATILMVAEFTIME